MGIRVLSDAAVVRHLLGGSGRYALWLGAGVSADSGIQTANAICNSIRASLLQTQSAVDVTDARAVEEWANRTLDWSDAQRRYTTSIRKAHPNPAMRVSYFRGLLRESKPAFCHYAAALLMASDYVDRTCVTTNFDHLLERAFAELNLVDYQAVRSEGEVQFWMPSEKRCFVVKLHGDIDTNNILNTTEETLEIPKHMRRVVFDLVRNKGLIVLGAAGNEKSVWKVFEAIEKEMAEDPGLLSFGLLWGVYVGDKKPAKMSDAEVESLVLERIPAAGISRDIVDMMKRSSNDMFAFFPVWGAGSFMLDVITATDRVGLTGTAARYLDHEMRLRHTFTGAGITQATVDKHLESLRTQRARLPGPAAQEEHEEVLRAAHASGRLHCRLIYGDITGRRLMSAKEFGKGRRAVVSPEDTYISAGGGVAFGLLKKAGDLLILNELGKLSPIPHRSVAVTSGGYLPVHYIVHAAALRIDEGPNYVVSREDVQATTEAVLSKSNALDVSVVFMPLLGAGVASLSAAESLQGIGGAVRAMGQRASDIAGSLTVVVVIYKERLLPRHEVEKTVREMLDGDFTVETV